MKPSHLAYMLASAITIAALAKPAIAFSQKNVDRILWEQGKGNYNNYRIPSVIVTKQGTILAFCEGREGGDSGDIDLLMKRSEDNGKTWSSEMIIWNDGKNTCGNPCPVVDNETGRIWLIMTWNNGEDSEWELINKKSVDTRSPFICYSDDDGQTWSVPAMMSSACKDPSWGWYATGPGIGIQLKNSRYKGRLIIPANHSYDDKETKTGIGPYGYGSHVLISDDHGKTWRMSRPILPGCNESQVTELSDGRLVMNMRSYNNKNCRALSFSSDGGETWSEISSDPQLVEPICQASLLDYGNFKSMRMYLFANPAVTFERTHMTVYVSFDDCQSWSNSRLVYQGPAAYSCLVKMNNNKVGLFFECGKNSPYETLRFISFPPDELFKPGTVIPE